MNKWMRFAAMILAMVMALQCLPVRTAALSRLTAQEAPEQGETVETGMIPVQVMVQEETGPEPEPLAIPEEPDDLTAEDDPIPMEIVVTTEPVSDFAWTLEGGVLTVSGTGDMPKWYRAADTPWYSDRKTITTIIVEEGLTNVGDYAFQDCSNVTSVTLPDGITQLGSYCFNTCTQLSELWLPESLTTINSGAFWGCYALTTVDIPDSVTTIRESAFRNCSALTDLTLPDGITSIADCTFQGCSALVSLTLPGSVTTLGTQSFAECSRLQEIILPQSLTSIGNYAFSSCKALETIVVPDSVTSVGSYAFDRCSMLREITLPAGLTTIRDYAFRLCTSLETIAFPASLTSIGNYAFYQCSGLMELELPDGLQTIYDYAFYECTGLESLEIPASVKTIDDYAFQYCSGLKTLKLNEGLTTIGTQSFGYCTALENFTFPESLTKIGTGAFSTCQTLSSVSLPNSAISLGNYAFTTCTALEEVRLPDGVTSIPTGLFYGCTALEGVEIPETVTYIGPEAFRGCTSLISMDIPESVGWMDYSIFENCSGLRSVTLPQNLTNLGNFAFKNCSSLEHIELPESLEYLGKSAFSGCTALEWIKMPESLTSLGQNVFQNCSSLKEVTIPKGTTAIGDTFCQNCTSLESVTIPDTVTSIGSCAFNNCPSLRSIDLPDAVTILDSNALSGSGITQIALPAGLTKMGDFALHNCDSLEYVEVPGSVTTLGNNVFSESESLKEVKFLDGATIIGRDMFYNCPSLKTVTMPDSITTIYSNAFGSCTALEEIELPAGLTTLSSSALSNCASLRRVILHDNLTEIGSYAFQYCCALEEIELPDSVTTIGTTLFRDCGSLRTVKLPRNLTSIPYEMFYQCHSLESVEIPDTVASIGVRAFFRCTSLRSVDIPMSVTSIGSSAFQNCEALEAVFITESVTTIDSYAFTATDLLTFYTHPGAYAWTYAEDRGIRLVNVLTNANLTMTVLDEDGNALTDGVTIEWYAKDSDEVLATGSTLRGVSKDQIAYDYAIILDEALSFRYRQPHRTAVVIENETYDLTRTLEPIGSLTLSGTVTDEDGQPLAGAALTLTQTYNEIYEKQLSAVTGIDGSFLLTVDAVPTAIRISAEGFCDRTVNADLTEKAGENQMEPVTMKPLPADKITLAVELVQVHAPGEAGFRAAVDNAEALEYAIYNVTQDREVTDFTVQLPWLLLGEAQAAPGDTLRITAADPENAMVAAPAGLTLDENRTGSVTVTFRQNGMFCLPDIVGPDQLALMVFDSEGTLVYSGEAYPGYESRNLPEEAYQLVLLEKNDLLRTVASLELLEQLGMTAGEDYALCAAAVSQGLITELDAITVPALDESKFNYMDAEATLLRLGRTTAYPEQTLTLRLDYRIDGQYPSSGETVRIQLPSDVTVASSVFLGRTVMPYTLEDSELVIPVNAAQGEITLYIRAEQLGEKNISAMLEFETGGGRVLQPLGQASLTVTAGQMYVPHRTNQTTVPVSGITMPDRLVKLYVNEAHVATTTSNAVGSWDLEVPLSKTYGYSYHLIEARVADEEAGGFYPIDSQFVQYDSMEVLVSSISMTNNIHFGQYQTTLFNFINPDPKVSYLIPMEDEIRFSFRIRFTGSDAAVLKNVVLVMVDMNGDEHRVRCSYDKNSDTWTAYFVTKSNEEAPTALGVCYDVYREFEDPVIDAAMVSDISQTILQVMEETDAQLDSIKYEDDGSLDEMSYEELAVSLDEDLDELEQIHDEVQYLFDSAMEDAAAQISQEGDTVSSTIGGISTDTTTIYLDEVDEDALLAEGYEKIVSSDGGCLYQKRDGDTIYYVDPVRMVKMIVVCYLDTEAAGVLASNRPTTFEKTMKIIEKAYGYVSKLVNGVNQVYQTLQLTEERLEKRILDGVERQAKAFAKANRLQKNIQEFIAEGMPEKELNRIREDYARRMDRFSKVNDWVKVQRGLLKTLRVVKAICKGLPVINLLLNIKKYAETQKEMERLWDELPKNCPADPAGLEKIKTEITNLSVYLYNIIAVDMLLDIAAIIGVFTTGAITAPATGGASLAGAIALAAGMIAANLAKDYAQEQYMQIKIDEIRDMIEALKCDKPKEKDPRQPNQWVYPRVIMDPSGYVYEAVPSNRIEGVKAEIYYKDGDEDVLWDAANYDQVNPYYTDAAGIFHWDVPIGQWLVKFSKDDYYDTDSRMDPAADDEGYLPVPPPQMEVNTAIVSKAAPVVESVQVYEDEMLVIFSQYMKPDTIGLTVSCAGDEVGGTVTASDAEWNYEQTEQYATTFRFAPDAELSGTADVTISGVNYAGTAMAEPWQDSVGVVVRPESIFAADTVSVVCGTAYQLEVQILPAGGGAGKTVTAESLAPMLLRVDTPSVTADENGRAVITVYGELPGTVELSLGLEGTDLRTTSTVSVSMPGEAVEICEKVTASIPNGSTVGVGTQLELYTATEGAQIYYTLDGTCPCVVDSSSRIYYDGPITLTEDTFLIAYAVKEGAQDSPTAGFIYNICTHSDLLLENDRRATCTEDGYTGDLICDDCGMMVEQGTVISAPGHSWDEGVVTIEPTEETPGEMRYTCYRCGEIRWEVIPELGHEHSYDTVVTDPTCTEGGYTTHTCRCGDSYTDSYTDALGHDMGQWYTVSEVTCTADGLERRECSRCDHSEERIIEAAGHDYESVVTEPTCTEEGYTTHTCHCGDSYVDSCTDALGHSFSDWIAGESGMEERSCIRCGYAEQRPASEPVNPFTDVPEGSFYYEPVLWAVENGITNGTTPTTFGPNDQCMRAHVVTFLWRAAGSPEPSSTETPFVDVKTTDFYYKAVLWAVEKGITNGLDATHFGPFAYCNRAQVVTFLYRSLGSPAVESQNNPFTDVPAGQWFTAPVLWAVENGVTNGLSATAFGPTAICNRAQIVTFLYRAFAD